MTIPRLFPLAALAAALLLASCQSTPAPLAADTASEIWFQHAQSASDLGQYDTALGIYQTFLGEKTSATVEDRFTARYEIALLLSKKGQTEAAIADFEAILADYGDLDKSAGAPGWVKILSEKKRNELQERLSRPKK